VPKLHVRKPAVRALEGHFLEVALLPLRLPYCGPGQPLLGAAKWQLQNTFGFRCCQTRKY
jgi:hypothetical protein